MRCIHCDYEIPDGVKFCPLCGAIQRSISAPPSTQQTSPPDYIHPDSYEGVKDSPKYVGFGDAIKLYFKNYINFSSRSTRSEYWYAYLFTGLIDIACWLINTVVPIGIIPVIADLVFFLPSLSISFRRFHDTGRTGALPLITFIANLVWRVLMGIILIMMLVAFFDSSDVDWNVLIILLFGVFILGIIPLGLKIYEIVICCLESQPNQNQYGREPRY